MGTLTNWKRVACGIFHTAAVKTDGTLWSWGKNKYGGLGLGDTTHRSSPVQVGTLTDWRLVTSGYYHIAAIKNDGTLWSWGRNNSGQLGLGDTANRSSPVQVGTLTNWKLVASGAYHVAAVKTDGTLWLWGYNNYHGGLGLGDTTNRSSPVQVGTLTNWKLVASGSDHTVAIQDGYL